MKIILASTSPRRREILENLGLDFDVLAPDADESLPDLMSVCMAVTELARRKVMAARALVPQDEDALVIAADTLVELDGKILGKPKDACDAAAMLMTLSGREHAVHTGIAVSRGAKTITASERTGVRFRTLLEDEIAAYIATGEPLDKAGAYGIQGRGALLVAGIDGDYFNVVGLPIARLSQLLRLEFGINLLNS